MTATGDRQNGRLRATWFALVLVFAVGGVGPAQAAVQDGPAARTSDLTPAQTEILRLAGEAATLFNADDFAGSEAPLRALLPLISEMFGPNSIAMSKLQVQLGDALRGQGKHAEAVTAYSAALEILEELRNQPPLEIEAIVYRLGDSQWAAGQLFEASQSYHRAAFIRENVLGARDTATAEALLKYSRVELVRGRYTSALPAAERAWSIQSEVWGERSLQAVEALNALAEARGFSGLWTQAEQDYRQVVALRQALAPEDEVSFANALIGLGSTLDDLGRYSEAEPLQLQALETLRRILGPRDPNLWWAVSGYANTVHTRLKASEPVNAWINASALGPDAPESRAARSRYATAETLYLEALAIARDGHGPRHELTAVSLANLANVLASQGRFTESEAMSREAIEIFEETLGPDHPAVGVARANLGNTLHVLGRYEEALDQHKWAQGIGFMVHTIEHSSMGELVNAVGLDRLMMGEVLVGVDYLDGAAEHRMGLVCPAGDQGPPIHHPWAYADPDCSGHPSFTTTVAANAAVRSVFENRPAASLRLVSHAGDMVVGRTRLRYAMFDDARTEARRFTYVHRQFVSSAWAVADPNARTEISEALNTFHWPYRSN